MGGKGSGPRKRINRTLPLSQVRPDVPPKWLDRKGKSEWKRIADIIDRVPDLLAEPDWDAVALLADAWSDFHAQEAIIRKEGTIAMSQAGVPYQHPSVGMKNKAFERITKLARELAMTPQARRLLNGVKPAKDERLNPLDEYLSRRGKEQNAN